MEYLLKNFFQLIFVKLLAYSTAAIEFEVGCNKNISERHNFKLPQFEKIESFLRKVIFTLSNGVLEKNLYYLHLHDKNAFFDKSFFRLKIIFANQNW